jgi:hypothetical protein
MAVALCEEGIIELLRQIQGDMTNTRFAEQLGVHESYLSKVYHREIPVGKKVLEGLAQLRPEYAAQLGLFLVSGLQGRRQN